ncbi:iduronate 2-sulfatase [Schistocerca nitens]|uniref:iduronate 2-sulfatase n=1 Tax=Schistocerca nitens TaxID=7011 RepID=UPI0021195E1F|nr:iduronate 2-sulfatase [Schistocerca nitens]
MSFVVRCLLFLAIVSSTGKAVKKNILFIVVDDLRPALGCYNDVNAHTPHINALAKKSVVFKHAFAQQALCAPSRNSFLTSRRPDSIRLYDFYSYWRETAGNFTTLPQYFKQNGYHTMSIGKIFHPGISSNYSDDQPYSWSEEPFHPPTEQYRDSPVCHGTSGQLGRNLICPVSVELQPGKSLPDLQSLEAAKKFLREKREEPFLLAVGFHKPHIPLKFPREYLGYHPLASIKVPVNHMRTPTLPTVAWNPWTDIRRRDDIASLNISFPFGPMPDETSKLIRQSYYAATSYIDDLIGQLLKELNSHNWKNNTIIILTGDHGWSLGEHGEWSKYSNFEVSVRVPLIIHVPGITDVPDYVKTNEVPSSSVHPSISNAIVELVDIFPTLVELSEAGDLLQQCPDTERQPTLCTEGVSLAPLIYKAGWKGQFTTRRKAAFSQYPRPGMYPTLKPNSDKPHLSQIEYMGYSLRTHTHRYTEWVYFQKQIFQPDWTKVVARELYDHTIDPLEDLNLADRPQLHDLVHMLSAQLHAGWRHSLATE